jgi:hypothetical protein
MVKGMEGSIGIAALYGHRERLAEGIASGKWKVESGKWKVESGKWKVTLATEMHGKHEKHGNCFAGYGREIYPFGDDYPRQTIGQRTGLLPHRRH